MLLEVGGTGQPGTDYQPPRIEDGRLTGEFKKSELNKDNWPIYALHRSTDNCPLYLMSGSLSLSFSAARQAFISDIFSIARSAGGEARLVGGVVRNGLLARHKGYGFDPEQDLDVAVSLPVTVFVEAARQQGLRVLETGLAHGTVTVMANEQQAE